MGGSIRFEHDFFVSHASEDQSSFVEPLASRLAADGYKVWYAPWALTLGDRLRESIDRGLASSRFGIVVLSEAFFAKHWPRQELDGLAALEVSGTKRILPIWHGLDAASIAAHSPTLADRIAIDSAEGLDRVVLALKRVIDVVSSEPPPSFDQVEIAHFSVRLKQLMPRSDTRIQLDDLVRTQFLPVEDRLRLSPFFDEEPPDATTIQARVTEYDRLLVPFGGPASTAGRWASPDQLTDWLRVVTRLGGIRPDGEHYTLWRNLRRYPAMLITAALVLGSLSGGRLDNVWRTLTIPTVKDRHGPRRACEVLPPQLVLPQDAGRLLEGMERRHTPTSDHLFDVLQDPLRRMFDDGEDLERAFDQFEVWAALAYADLVGRDWVPLGRFAWKYLHSPEASPRAQFSDADFRERALAAGAFGGEPTRLEAALERFDRHVSATSSSFW